MNAQPSHRAYQAGAFGLAKQDRDVALLLGPRALAGVSAVVGLAFLLMTALLFSIASRQDATSLVQSQTYARTALDRKLANFGGMIREYAYWGDAYRHLNSHVDLDWAYTRNNFGVTLYEDVGVDYVLIIGPDGRVTYNVIRGRLGTMPAAGEGLLEGGLPGLVAQARLAAAKNGDDTVAVTTVLAAQGLPVLAAAGVLSPGADPSVTRDAGPPSVVVFGSLMTPERLNLLGTDHFVPALRLAAGPVPGASIGLPTQDGSMTLWLQWDPLQPGTAMLRSVAPWLIGIGLLLALLTWLVLRHAARASAALAKSLLRVEQARSDAERAALHDPTTGLPNRLNLCRLIRQDLERQAGCTAVIFIDFNGFKLVNDAKGYTAGDHLLVMISGRLKGLVERGDVIARVGGHQFVVVAGRRNRTEVDVLTEVLRAGLRRPYALGPSAVHLTPWIGVALSPGDGADAEELLRLADVAMYHARAGDLGDIRYFSAEMDENIRSRRSLEEDLRGALGRGEFFLVYQPRFCASSLEVRGVEALLRWRHPEKGLVGPASFIPLAEQTGVICEIGAWVLETACAWAASRPALRVSVNISPVQMREGDLVRLVADALARSGLPPDRLELELTEGVLVEDSDQSTQLVRRLKSLGIELSLDDFGTGYSSLSYLRNFPFDCLKMDHRFIADLRRHENTRSIVQAVVALGRALGMFVTAEGVETMEQLQLLREDGCTEVQGFFLARPLEEEALDAFLPAWPGIRRDKGLSASDTRDSAARV